ncbi:hypothetical protein F7731_02680 [Cytobacillus depressus]|uniref:YqhR n=1 Tax=Cytobacillus depressus TaxID=1602942 RepID=A0A6L3VG07_9BACI|nr:YqhR family membrane protein [Cytobacillus depressus]KAB2338484.1 hypothetical protein F7731_02680 [Cytobacillus depressus]
MSEEKHKDQQQDEKPMSFVSMVIVTGLIGGLFWSLLGYLAHLINLTEIHPNVILEPWAAGNWKNSGPGTFIAILLIGAVSIVVALIYYALLRRFPSIWVGILYGIGLFCIVFFVLNPIFPGISPIKELSRDTLITSICLYVLYGVFVGYSISYEEGEIQYREKRANDAKS